MRLLSLTLIAVLALAGCAPKPDAGEAARAMATEKACGDPVCAPAEAR